MQKQKGTSVRFLRRGWDFGLPNVIKWFHEDAQFREAADAAHPPDFQDPDGLFGNPYLHLLDDACNGCFSKRQSASEAGLYVLGAMHGHCCCLCPVRVMITLVS